MKRDFHAFIPNAKITTRFTQASKPHNNTLKNNYPAEYKCSECNGEWYTKGEYNYHFWIPCSHCGELVKKGSQSAHRKKLLLKRSKSLKNKIPKKSLKYKI